jgi:RNA polymerase sigma-70 factor (ECF subfamily)
MPTGPKPRKIRDADFELIREINSGQKDRSAELIQKYEQRLYNFGLRMCRDVQDAEDLVQDTFLNVFRYLDAFRFETKFKNWLYRIATTSCIKKRRRSKFAPDKELSLEDLLPGDDNDVPDQDAAWLSIPLEQLLNEELSLFIHQAIGDIPEKYRVVVVLRDMEGFSTEETAQILNLTPANVKVRLHRARLFLREKLKGYFRDGKA